MSVRDDYPLLNVMAGAGPSEEIRLEASRALVEIDQLRQRATALLQAISGRRP